MGHEMVGIDTDPYIYGNVFTRFHHHLNVGPGIHKLNSKIVVSVATSLPEIIWVDNKSFLTARTLRHIKKILPAAKIINVITDDITGSRKYAWRLGLKAASLFDCHFVQRSVNINELKDYGANRVELCYRSFDPDFHRPVVLDASEWPKYKTRVGFIGTWEEDREAYIAFLINNKVEVSVTGDGWPKGKYWNTIGPFYKGPSIYGEAYIKTINGMDIALHFLRNENRDEQDSRTFEIPACKVFMMAERSTLHQQLFKENEEAVFFDSKAELLEKVQFYLNERKERNRIALNGYNKCFAAGYSHEDRLKNVIEQIVR